MYVWLERMRFLLAVVVAAGTVLPLAHVAEAGALSCAVNGRSGSSVAARRLPNEGAVRTRIAYGTVVEEVTFANDRNGVPWVLIGEPGDPIQSYGWVDRRAITCNWAG